MENRSLPLLERLEKGPVICAEGYLFELERRGYLQAGAFVPEVVLEHPEAVTALHQEFVNAGSDVVEALTYYAHREKLKLVGRENQLEEINRKALGLAKDVARTNGALFAGNICNTNIFIPNDQKIAADIRAIYEEQVAWAKEAGVDFIIAETIAYLGEALIALDVIKKAGLTSVVTLAIHRNGDMRDGFTAEDACKQIKDAGADVVGLNCIRGPLTMWPMLERIRAAVPGHLAALPVPYRTTAATPTFESLVDTDCSCAIPGNKSFPSALDPFVATRFEMGDFAARAHKLGFHYIGICCGAGPHHVRSMAEALGKQPNASKYSPDMSKHYSLGTDARLKQHNREYSTNL